MHGSITLGGEDAIFMMSAVQNLDVKLFRNVVAAWDLVSPGAVCGHEALFVGQVFFEHEEPHALNERSFDL